MNALLTGRPVGVAISVSVLMSTYGRETAAHLEECLASLEAQTLAPTEIVLVVDGPIDEAQERVISHYSASSIPLVTVRLASCHGLAAAMNAGLEVCRGDFVMRMDSDDICEPDRNELQLAYLIRHPEVDLVGSWCSEFSDDNMITGSKVSPCAHAEIVAALRFRNVLVHPTVLIRREKLDAVGGYRSDFGRLEDYDLFVRLVVTGATMHVIPRRLIRVRTSLAQRSRRGGWGYLRNEICFRWHCLKIGFLSPKQFMLTVILYGAFRLAGPLRRTFYGLARA